MSMLTFYANRAGRNLQRAKGELRKLFHRMSAGKRRVAR
jgi:hypothetical protein